jgi:hypothetical protein
MASVLTISGTGFSAIFPSKKYSCSASPAHVYSSGAALAVQREAIEKLAYP